MNSNSAKASNKSDLGCADIAHMGGFTPLQCASLTDKAQNLGATPMQVALAWLLERSPNILLIPGTSSLKHLREKLQAAQLEIPSEVLVNLNSIGKPEKGF